MDKKEKAPERVFLEMSREAALVTESALETLKLADRISKVGNKMLSSDFEICKIYSFAAIKASIVNVDINLSSLEDEEYNIIIKQKYTKILEEAKKIFSCEL